MMRRFEPSIRPIPLRIAGILGLGLLIAIVVWWPMVREYPKTPIGDGHGFYFNVEISRAAVRIYHEMPLWNPFDCRGSPMWDHPENITASPAFFLTLPFKSAGPFVLVWHFAHIIVGFLGAWLLCRDDLKLSRAATFIAASAWAFGATHSQYSGGHFAFMSFYHAPLMLFAWRKAEHSWNWCVGTGLLLAWMVYDGATYPLPFIILFLGIESCTRLTSVRRALHLAACAGVVGLVGFSIGASRILPIQAQFSAHNRVMEDDWDQLTNIHSWIQMYLARTPAFLSHMPGQQYVFGEYQAYIGLLGFLLFVLGLAFMASESTWLVVIMLVLVLLMLGHFSPRAPWSLLHSYVPPFKSMRVPSRFRLLLALPVALSMAYAVDRLPPFVARLKPSFGRALRVVLIGIGGLAVGDNAGLLTELLEPRFQDAAPVEVARSPRFYYGGALPPDIINMPRSNHAWLGCRTTWAYNTEAALWTGDVPQARAVNPQAAVVENVSRTHNRFTLDVDVKEPSRILLNSGFDLGWESNVGTVVSNDTLLALDLPAGHHHVQMRYWPRRLTLGICLTVLGLIGSLGFLMRRQLRGGRA
jgi:hypothetical protein